MAEKSKSFNFLVKAYKFFTRKYNEVKLDDEPAVYVSNHCKLGGPIYFQAYFPNPKKIWVIGDMCDKDACIEYMYDDFFRLKKPRWLYITLAKLIRRPFLYMTKNADAIPVYKDMRIASTLKNSIKALKNNENIVIMPEHHVEYNHVVHEFQRNYIELARLYYKMTGKQLKFYPVYLAPKLRKVVIGEPIEFDPSNDIEDEKDKINYYLMEEITKLYGTLKKHKVVLYD